MIHRVKAFMYSPGLSYAFFTQITDVENERNGLFTYDRAFFKADMDVLKAASDDLIAASRELNEVPATANTFTNFSAETDVTAPATGEEGIRFRMDPTLPNTADDHGYFASIATGTGVMVSYVSAGSWTPIKAVPMPIAAGQKYHLRVDAFGGTIRVFVDDMATPMIEVTDYRSLTGTVSVAATNPFVRLQPFKTERFVIHNSKDKDVIRLDDNVSRDDDALWQIVPGLANAQGISLESARLPGFYLRDNAGIVDFEKDDGSSGFKNDATWNRKPGLSGSEGFSYESSTHSGEYLRQSRGALSRSPVPSDGDKIDATFIERK